LHQIRSAPAVRGDIIVAHENVTALGRYSDVAKIGGGQVSEALLPALYDFAGLLTGRRAGLSYPAFSSKGR